MRRKWRSLALFCVSVLAASLLCPSALAASGAAFVNVPVNAPYLYVRQQVEALDPAYPADPSDTFTLTLYVNGEPARNTAYVRYDSELQPEKGTSATGHDGTFSLRAGEWVRFSLTAGDEYELIEAPAEGYTQILPANGASATGLVETTPTSVTFRSLYVPGAGSDLSPESALRVCHEVVLPDGYAIPGEYAEAETVFSVTLDDAPCAETAYELLDSAGNALGKYNTSADGHFALCANQTAVFTVDTGCAYKVEQIPAEDTILRALTGATSEGVAQSPLTYVPFTSAFYSFGVETRLEGGAASELSFSFDLKDRAGGPLADASYYIYDVYSGAQVGSATVGGDGRFSLGAGQVALFYGLSAGTTFSVSQRAAPSWRQLTPLDAGGYTGRTVPMAADAPVLRFVDRLMDGPGSLNVTAEAEVLSGGYDADTEFPFYLTNESGGPVGGTEYTVGSGTETQTLATDEDGGFRLKAGQTAHFSGLAYGTYTVTEVLDGTYPTSWTIRGEDGEQVRSLGKTAEVGAAAGNILFTNCYEQARVELPETGGPGVRAFGPAGAAMLAAAGTGLVYLRRTRRRSGQRGC